MTPIQQMLLGAGAKQEAVHIDDVFNTYLYKGDNSARSINTGLKMTDGGMVWIKGRAINSHALFDTERGASKWLTSQANVAPAFDSASLTSFNSNGFSLGTGCSSADVNCSSSDQIYASWNFKKQEKFFTMVSYTGDGTSNRVISHDLNAVVGCMMIKDLTDANDWVVFHRGISSAHGKPIFLNSDGIPPTPDWSTNSASWFGHTAPNDDRFTIGNNDKVNKDGNSYIAYFFAHHDSGTGSGGEFGPNEDQRIISCGQVTNINNSSGATVTLDFEPQWLLLKSYSHTSDWILIDSMRGMPYDAAQDMYMKANTNVAEQSSTTSYIDIKADGFHITPDLPGISGTNSTSDWLYIAIAAPTGKNCKPIETGTDVLAMDTGGGSSTIPNFDSGFPVDFVFLRDPNTSHDWYAGVRKMNGKVFYNMNDTNAASGPASGWDWDSNEGFSAGNESSSIYSWMFKRHAGFDVVVTQPASNNTTNKHSLGVVPEMIWGKAAAASSYGWQVYHKGLNGGTNPHQYYLKVNTNDGEASSNDPWNNTAPTASVFSTSDAFDSQARCVFLLFASVEGVSKVGSYDGSSSNVTLDLGFQPRFLLIKRTDASDSWMLFDSKRGINGTNNNDRLIHLDTNAAQSGDYPGYNFIDISSSGATIMAGTHSGQNNGSGSKYIYYAHA